MALSVSDPSHIAAGMVSWSPLGFNLVGYELILKDPDLLITYKNTLLYAGVGTFLTLLLTSLIAYPLALREFILRKHITIFPGDNHVLQRRSDPDLPGDQDAGPAEHLLGDGAAPPASWPST